MSDKDKIMVPIEITTNLRATLDRLRRSAGQSDSFEAFLERFVRAAFREAVEPLRNTMPTTAVAWRENRFMSLVQEVFEGRWPKASEVAPMLGMTTSAAESFMNSFAARHHEARLLREDGINSQIRGVLEDVWKDGPASVEAARYLSLTPRTAADLNALLASAQPVATALERVKAGRFQVSVTTLVRIAEAQGVEDSALHKYFKELHRKLEPTRDGMSLVGKVTHEDWEWYQALAALARKEGFENAKLMQPDKKYPKSGECSVTKASINVVLEAFGLPNT